MEKVELGDFVTFDDGNGNAMDCAGEVIAILGLSNPQHSAVAITYPQGYLITNGRFPGDATLDKQTIDYLLSRGICKNDIHSYIGRACLIVLKDYCAPAKQTNPSQGRICTKCGQFDEYAAPSPKHNNEVRCYRHC